MRITIDISECLIKNALKGINYPELDTDADAIEEEGNAVIESSTIPEDEKRALKEKWHNEILIFKMKQSEPSKWNEERVREELEEELDSDVNGLIYRAIKDVIDDFIYETQEEIDAEAGITLLKEKLEEIKYTTAQ